MRIHSGQTILFQGDSITDANKHFWSPHDLGNGYVKMVAQRLSTEHPEVKVNFLNRGVSGNRIRDLRERWQTDCLELKPDIVSIMIGVNDTLATFFWGEPTSNEDFKRDYTNILQLTQKNLNTQIVLMEPFILPFSAETVSLIDDINTKTKIVKKLAEEFSIEHIQLNSIFSDALEKKPPEFWSTDGVHPTPAGHTLIADSWLNKAQFT
jgi:acyl-CoA thioesterase-1